MNALILAAGLGTRLMPLTACKPKALVEIAGKPMLQIAVENLINQGFNRIVVNVHHFAPMVINFIKTNRFDAEILISDESLQLMDTGGAIVKARKFLDVDEPFLVHNVDIISNIDLCLMYKNHLDTGALATLSVSTRSSNRVFLFDSAMNLCGWKNNTTGECILPVGRDNELNEYAFSGVHIISPRIFKLVNSTQPFSIVKEYLKLCNTNKILGLNHSENFVLDLGKPERIRQAEDYLR